MTPRPATALEGRTPEDIEIDADAAIPAFRPYLGPEVHAAVDDALKAGFLGLGSRTRDFELGLEAFLGVPGRYAVATSSCTEALTIAATLAGIGEGDEVICPAFTYVAGHQAMTATGADVVFCDIEPDTLGVDVERMRELIGPHTKALMLMHYGGVPCRDTAEIHALAKERGLRVIEDAAHALGSTTPDGPVGGFGDLTCFSFGPIKMITTLEGGAVITGREEDVQVLHELRLIGVNSDTEARYRNTRNWHYDVTRQGFRSHLGSIPAAIGTSQLGLVHEFIANRQAYCQRYDEAFADIGELTRMEVDWSDVGIFIYTVQCPDAERREGLMAHLRERGIASGIHFEGAHTYTFYKSARRGDLSVTERVSERIVTLPLHSYMSDTTLRRVIDGVRSYFGR
jgi:dTDP-4-amino-4,6-dideoxygalactose transaminase